MLESMEFWKLWARLTWILLPDLIIASGVPLGKNLKDLQFPRL